jgi:anti-anti-sigma factor
VAEPSSGLGTVEFAQLEGKVAVIRVSGRCSFQNSAYLEKAAELCQSETGPCSFVLDLRDCQAMDSTFLGTLAGIALRQKAAGRDTLIAVNVSKPLQRTMSLLGLTHILDIREAHTDWKPDQEIAVGETDKVEMSRAEQVAHMIEAHRRLIEIDSGNEVRFEDVLKYLDESLERARAAERKKRP